VVTTRLIRELYKHCANEEFLTAHELYNRQQKEARERELLLRQQEEEKLYSHQLYHRHAQVYPQFNPRF
jgi:hypothetical protein